MNKNVSASRDVTRINLAVLFIAVDFCRCHRGLIAFGIIGLFIGPVVPAVSHVLLKAWVSED